MALLRPTVRVMLQPCLYRRVVIAALQDAAPFISSLPTGYVPLRSINILGLTGLRSLLGENLFETALPPVKNLWMPPPMDSLQEMANAIESGGYGVVMTLGKGGVGKTTVAAALAILLARRGHTVHLSTTDPAAHLAETVSGPIQGLTVSRIDPRTETTFYRQEILKNQAATLDPASLAVLEEDLRSPCTEEIAVFRAFAREVSGGTSRFVVLDTAPTGHTLLLLDASESYTRELHRQSRGDSSESIVKLLERLRDPSFTRFLLVTLAEATPVHEALALQEDLRRAEIKPFGWIINQSLLNSGSSHPLLQGREQSEHRYIEEVMAQQPPRVAWIPWRLMEPIGSEALVAMAATKPILSSWIPPLVLP